MNLTQEATLELLKKMGFKREEFVYATVVMSANVHSKAVFVRVGEKGQPAHIIELVAWTSRDVVAAAALDLPSFYTDSDEFEKIENLITQTIATFASCSETTRSKVHELTDQLLDITNEETLIRDANQ